jgi:hypothetical protein
MAIVHGQEDRWPAHYKSAEEPVSAVSRLLKLRLRLEVKLPNPLKGWTHSGGKKGIAPCVFQA